MKKTSHKVSNQVTGKWERIIQSVMESSISGLAINDLEGKYMYIYANKAFLKMVGCERDEEILGKTLLEFVQDEYRDKTLDVMKRCEAKAVGVVNQPL